MINQTGDKTTMSKAKFTPINGYTKTSIIETLRLNFRGKSIGKGTNQCLYRTEEGLKCAVGCFIPDAITKVNTNEANGQGQDGILPIGEVMASAESLLMNNPHLQNFMPLEGVGLNLFQNAHDILNRDASPPEQLAVLEMWVNTNVAGE